MNQNPPKVIHHLQPQLPNKGDKWLSIKRIHQKMMRMKKAARQEASKQTLKKLFLQLTPLREANKAIRKEELKVPLQSNLLLTIYQKLRLPEWMCLALSLIQLRKRRIISSMNWRNKVFSLAKILHRKWMLKTLSTFLISMVKKVDPKLLAIFKVPISVLRVHMV